MDKSILDKVESILKEEAIKENLQFISCRYYKDTTGNILEVLVDKDFQITLDEVNSYTNSISALLDSLEELNGPYMLDVCSGGSERIIQKEDLSKLIDKYLDILLKTGERLIAKLVSFNDEEIDVLYFLKGRKKKQQIKFEDITNIHIGYKN